MTAGRVDYAREATAGLTTFLTMSYIVVVNPSILATKGTGMSFSGAMTSTVLVAFLGTMAMGMLARLPYAVAPGMGLNAFFAFTLVLGKGVPWQTALGLVFWSGVIFLLISTSRAREAIVKALPLSLRSAAAAGIGLLLTFIGLRNAGIVVADPQTLVRLGDLGIPTLLALLGLVLAAGMLMRDHPFSFLASIAVVTALGWMSGQVEAPATIWAVPDFSGTLLQLDLVGALQWTLVPALMALMVTDLFDSVSTFVGVARIGGLTTESGEPLRLRQGLIVDAGATLLSGLAGTSPATTYVESSAGIRVGGRTGWTAVFAALCFLPCLFLAPLAAAVPSFATAPVLILVGLFMFGGVRDFELAKLEEALPPFLVTILIPLTFSITQGVLWGLVSHVALYTIRGRAGEIGKVLWIMSAAATVLLILDV